MSLRTSKNEGFFIFSLTDSFPVHETFPTSLVAVAMYSPSSSSTTSISTSLCMLPSDSNRVSAFPSIFAPLLNHSTSGAGWPKTSTSNRAVSPSVTVTSCGLFTISGGRSDFSCFGTPNTPSRGTSLCTSTV